MRVLGSPAVIVGIPMDLDEQQHVQLITEFPDPVPHAGTSHEYQLDIRQLVDATPVGGNSYSIVTRALNTDTDGDGVADVIDDDDDNDGVVDLDDPMDMDPSITLPGPEIQVSLDTVDLADGLQAADFGSTSIGAPVTRTFTVSNLGMLGVSEFFPIINPPEAGILGIGAVEKRLDLLPGGKVAARDMLPLTLGCDHRAVDGFYAGQFLQSVREEMEKIELWQTL